MSNSYRRQTEQRSEINKVVFGIRLPACLLALLFTCGALTSGWIGDTTERQQPLALSSVARTDGIVAGTQIASELDSRQIDAIPAQGEGEAADGNRTLVLPAAVLRAAGGCSLNFGVHPAHANLAADAFTVEGWVNLNDPGANLAPLFDHSGNQGGVGWSVAYGNGGAIHVQINSDGAHATASTAALGFDDEWRHVAVTYSNSGDKIHRIYVDGVPANSVQTGMSGAPVSDTGAVFQIGGAWNGSAPAAFNGSLGWARLSSTLRYFGGFTPPSRQHAPSDDAQTVILAGMVEGSGEITKDFSANHFIGQILAGTDTCEWVGDLAGTGTAAFQPSASPQVCITDNPSIRNLHHGPFTIELWAYLDATTLSSLVSKGIIREKGWSLSYINNRRFLGATFYDTNPAQQNATAESTPIDRPWWYHIALAFDGSSATTTPQLWINGLDQTAAATNYQSEFYPPSDDTGYDLCVGNNSLGWHFRQRMGWIRISSGLRYTEPFFPQGMGADAPPPDGNALLLFDWEGCDGGSVTDKSNNGNNGNLDGVECGVEIDPTPTPDRIYYLPALGK